MENHIKIVEWPELIKIKPKSRIDILFHYSEDMKFRNVEVIGFGKWEDYKFNAI